jgi:YgiT-type zinc finger domain-containing protein
MTNIDLEIRSCPTCGSRKIRRVRRGLTRTYRGRTYTVPSVAIHECPDCGERLFDRVAMRKIEARSPAFRKAKAVP